MATSTMGDLKAGKWTTAWSLCKCLKLTLVDTAIEENLETSGKLGSIRALLRAEVFHLMTESEGQGTALSDENLVCECIRNSLLV